MYMLTQQHAALESLQGLCLDNLTFTLSSQFTQSLVLSLVANLSPEVKHGLQLLAMTVSSSMSLLLSVMI